MKSFLVCAQTIFPREIAILNGETIDNEGKDVFGELEASQQNTICEAMCLHFVHFFSPFSIECFLVMKNIKIEYWIENINMIFSYYFMKYNTILKTVFPIFLIVQRDVMIQLSSKICIWAFFLRFTPHKQFWHPIYR